jgi:hypothetical protein
MGVLPLVELHVATPAPAVVPRLVIKGVVILVVVGVKMSVLVIAVLAVQPPAAVAAVVAETPPVKMPAALGVLAPARQDVPAPAMDRLVPDPAALIVRDNAGKPAEAPVLADVQ